MNPETMRTTRQDLGLSQEEMASVLCLSRHAIMRHEAGSHPPTAPVAMMYRELANGWEPQTLRDVRAKKAEATT